MGPGAWFPIMGLAVCPKALAEEEWPTIQAMIMSYRQNQGVIEQQTQQVIAQAKENKAFENYTLDHSVVQDNEIPAHGTFKYPTADWLVKSDPNRFQYVSMQDLLKGVDY